MAVSTATVNLASNRPKDMATLSTVRDLVCGMEIDPASAAGRSDYRGETYFFCSAHCKQKFDANPAQYVGDGDMPAESQSAASRGCCCHGSSTAAKTPETGSCCHGGGHEHDHHSQAETATAAASRKPAKKYFCPMCEGVESDTPASCPKCGMALESATPQMAQRKTIYTCPMHPEIEQDHPGSCPICGMALEPKTVTAEPTDDGELRDMTRRFWMGAVLALPVFLLGMAHMFTGAPHWVGGDLSRWMQLALSTPVVLWAGAPFFERGWRSVRTMNLNMFTLISMGIGVAYIYSVVVMLAPGVFPPSFRADGKVGVYFEAAAVITVLVLLGARAQSAQPHRHRDPRSSRSRAANRAPHSARRRERSVAR